MRPNRFKEILSGMGFKVDERQQPLNSEVLDLLELTAKRVRQIMEGKGDKELTVKELESICRWLSIQPADILLPQPTHSPNEKIKVKVIAEVLVLNSDSKETKVNNQGQRNLFANA